MLIPRRNTLLEERIVVNNSLIQSDPEWCFKIMMENYSLNTVHLGREEIVGTLDLVSYTYPLGEDLKSVGLTTRSRWDRGECSTVQCAAKSGYTHY